MNFRFRSLTLTAVGLSVLALSTGCEVSKCKTDEGQDATCAESLETTYGPHETLEATYDVNMDLNVDGVKGEILVVPGTAGVVRVTFKPFTVRGHSKDADAQEDLEQGWIKDVRVEGNAVVVETFQNGESDEVGAAMEIELPPEFNGAINIMNRSVGEVDQGRVIINDVASAHSVHVESLGLGLCDIDGAPSVTNTYVSCEGIVEVVNVSDNVTVFAEGTILDDEPFGARVSFAGIAEGATGGEIESQHGHVELNLPGDGHFQITAAANEEGEVLMNPAPDTCEASDNVVTCGNGDAIYIVSAGTADSLDPGNVHIDFH